jgi:phage tail sheath protein FI
MPANFIHGVETVEVRRGPRPIRTVKTAVIALIGTAPTGPVQAQAVCLSDVDAAQFGPALAGFSIPEALDAIYDQGAGTVIVVNVLDPDTHKTDVADEVVVLDGDDGQTEFPAWIGNPVVKNSGGTTTYVKDTDYEFTADEALRGQFRRKTGDAIAADASLKLSYTYADPSQVAAADIIGAVNGAGVRTGLQALLDSFGLFGYGAKILIAPGWCTQASVAAAMLTMAGQLRAIALLDAPVGTTRAQTLAGRGPSGAINFYTSDQRAVLCFPHVKVYDGATDSVKLQP